MVAKRSKTGQAKSATTMAENKWLDLPIGPLCQIFTNLSLIDMILLVPLVCKSWGRIICKLIFFKENSNLLDFTPLLHQPFWCSFRSLGNENFRAMKLMSFLVGVMHTFAADGESGAGTCAVRAIHIPRGLPFYDRHLLYVAARSPQLKSIILLCAENITDKGITRAMQFWTGMEEMTYGPFCAHGQHLSRTTEEIGINCKNLRFLQLNWFDLHWQSADLIVRNIKSLKLLCLHCVNVHKYGLQILLSRCKKLDGIKFTWSIFVDSAGMEFAAKLNIMRIQEGRRTRWRTDRHPDEIDKLHTSKELVDLLWK